MNTDDYNQIELQKNILDAPELLKEGEHVTVMTNADDGIPLSVDMPASVILEVTHSEPGVKGNTATNATKPATLETGAKKLMSLCLSMKETRSKVDTEKSSYIERIKE